MIPSLRQNRFTSLKARRRPLINNRSPQKGCDAFRVWKGLMYNIFSHSLIEKVRWLTYGKKQSCWKITHLKKKKTFLSSRRRKSLLHLFSPFPSKGRSEKERRKRGKREFGRKETQFPLLLRFSPCVKWTFPSWFFDALHYWWKNVQTKSVFNFPDLMFIFSRK